MHEPGDAVGGAVAHRLERLRKSAKQWLAALRDGDPEAIARYTRAVGAPPPTGDDLTLRAVQHALAREHGADGWIALKEAIAASAAADAAASAASAKEPASRLADYELRATALLDAYTHGTPEALERHYALTWHRRAWKSMREYVQLDLGKRPQHPGDDVPLTIDDARQHVAMEHGFRNWAELHATIAEWPADAVMAVAPVGVRAGRSTRDDDESEAPLLVTRHWGEALQCLADRPGAVLEANGQMTDDLLARVAGIPHLEVVRLGGSKAVTDAGIRHLARLPQLRELDLSSTGVTDAGLAVLRDLPQLARLNLVMTRVTDAGMTHLAHARALERLELMWTNTGDGAIRALEGLPSFRELISGNLVTDAGLAALHGIPRFVRAPVDAPSAPIDGGSHSEVALRGPFTDRGMAQLRGLDGLESLSLNDCGVTAQGIAPLTSLARLWSLWCDPDDAWMPHIAALPALRALGAQDTVAGDAGFVALSASRTIERIWGRRCHNLRTRGFIALSRMPALRVLSVSCLNVEDAGIATLPDFPALRDLMPMDVPDAGYRHIARCTALEVLTLMYCRNTTDAATEHITGLAKLRKYFNSYTVITDRTPALLSTMDALEEITLSACNNVTDDGVAQLARLPRLRKLAVSGTRLTPAVAARFPKGVTVRYSP